jgi:GDP-L-fucose synthase
MELTNKNIIVTGANGLVGLPTVRKCLEENASMVYAVDIAIGDQLKDLKSKFQNNLELVKTDLTYLDNCENLFKDKNIDIVLHIAGVKGSPERSSKQPCDYLFPMLMFNTNMIKSSYDAKVEWFVYLSSVGVYQPNPIMREEDVWSTVPSKNDWYPGWTKRMGEASLEALKVQYGWDKWTVIRPSNIYGINDNFSPNATVISTNIWKLFNVEGDEIVCWGDGSAKRDFVFADDVAQASIDVVKKEVNDILNFGCGEAVSIKDTIDLIINSYNELTGKIKNIVWDKTKTNGDPIRCLSADKQKAYGILPHTTLKEGIKKTLIAYSQVKKHEQK